MLSTVFYNNYVYREMLSILAKKIIIKRKKKKREFVRELQDSNSRPSIDAPASKEVALSIKLRHHKIKY